MWKRDALQQSISKLEIKHDAGQIGLVTGMFFALFLAILLMAQLQLELYLQGSFFVEDALAASNLAAAVVDIREYGISHRVLLTEPERAYWIYEQALTDNLNLDEHRNCRKTGLITGEVKTERFIVYNVADDLVNSFEVKDGVVIATDTGSPGTVEAPNHKKVEHTGIYSEISFRTRDVFGITTTARKGKLVDVVGKED